MVKNDYSGPRVLQTVSIQIETALLNRSITENTNAVEAAGHEVGGTYNYSQSEIDAGWLGEYD